MTSADVKIQKARKDLAATLRMADRLGFSEGVCNHFSYAIPGAEGLLSDTLLIPSNDRQFRTAI